MIVEPLLAQNKYIQLCLRTQLHDDHGAWISLGFVRYVRPACRECMREPDAMRSPDRRQLADRPPGIYDACGNNRPF